MTVDQITLKLVRNKLGQITRISCKLPYLRRRKGDFYFVSSPLFKGLGKSKVSYEDAVSDLKKDVDAFFDIHIELGTVDDALEAFGWTKKGRNYKSLPLAEFNLNSSDYSQFEKAA